MARKSNGNSIRKIDTEGLKMRYPEPTKAVII